MEGEDAQRGRFVEREFQPAERLEAAQRRIRRQLRSSAGVYQEAQEFSGVEALGGELRRQRGHFVQRRGETLDGLGVFAPEPTTENILHHAPNFARPVNERLRICVEKLSAEFFECAQCVAQAREVPWSLALFTVWPNSV